MYNKKSPNSNTTKEKTLKLFFMSPINPLELKGGGVHVLQQWQVKDKTT